jgi:leader peptidase (prepilin peptidase)/N-methyltransferase
MYFNNIHIVIYLIIAAVGLFVGKIVAWCNMRLPEEKSVFSKEFFKLNKEGLEKNYIMMILMAIIYVALLYKFGWKSEFYKNLDLIKFLILSPMLVCAFFIDLKHRIIPNRLNLSIFETGLVLTVIYGLNNINIAKDMLLGMLAGAGIFIVITLLGGLIAGKEAMGLGDVKFMGAVGLFFGYSSIAEISLLAFFIAAILSIVILIVRHIRKIDDEYIPFGPFLVLASFFCIFAPSNTVFVAFLSFCKLISNKLLGIE